MKPSMSALAVIEHCRHAFRPDVTWPAQDTSEEAEFGNGGHAFAERWIRNHVGLEPISADKDEQIRSYEKSEKFRLVTDRMVVWLEKNARLGWVPEQAYAWDYIDDTARILPAEYHRDYRDARETEIPGTLDVATLNGSSVEIIDFKTGATPSAHYRWQMNIGALAAARRAGFSTARSRLVYFWPDSEPMEVVKDYDAMELDSIAYALQGYLLEARDDKPEPIPGEHCASEYCPARGTCAASMALIQQAAPSISIAELAVSSINTPEAAGRAYLQLKVIQEASRVIRNRIEEVVKKTGQAPTAHGKVLRVVREGRETYSKERLLEAGSRGKELLGELRALGAVQKVFSDKLKETKP